jgi:LysR family transcriptional regulator, carnitine catabolism transcriptional activator
MDLRRLGLFLAVVDHGGFTAAAHAIHVAQPSISLAVRELERELGAELIVRSRRGATLTPAGEALVGPARQAQRDVATAAAAVAAVTGLTAGHLDIASLPTLAADPLARMVGRFRREHPAVTVRLAAPDDPADVAESVRSGDTEIGLTEAGRATEGLEEIYVADQDVVSISPPGTASTMRPLELRRLADTPLVLTPRGTSIRTLAEAAFERVGVEPNIVVETAQRDALIPLVLAGAGATFVPAGVAETAAALGAVIRPTRPALRRTVALVHRPGTISPAAAHFIRLAR